LPAATRTLTTLAFTSMLLCAEAAAAPPRPADVPGDRERQGDAFVEAWLALRTDLDRMSHGGVHPRLLDEWMAAAPRFLVRDAVQLATAPQVTLAAARRLARRPDDADRALLAELERAHRGQPQAHAYWALRIRARSPRALERALSGLGDPRPAPRLAAARALAAAGDRRGLKQLRKLFDSGGEQSDEAARALGAYGTPADESLLRRALDRPAAGPALRAALGELALRRVFDDHYLALVRRDPSGQRLITSGGLYDTWLDAIGRAVREGVRGAAALVGYTEQLRREAGTGEERDVIRRRLAALIEFWTATNLKLRSTPPRPTWPTGFDEALRRVRGETDDGDATPAGFASRVTASIAICAWTAPGIGHDRLARPTPGLRFITPGGARTADGSFSTSWRLVAGQSLVAELAGAQRVDELWLANTCQRGTGPRVMRLQVRGSAGDDSWTVEAALGRAGRYFERVDLGGRRAERIQLTFAEVEGSEPACLAELRLF
jgi:hypothetical protein